MSIIDDKLNKINRIGQPVICKSGFTYSIGIITEFKELTAIVKFSKNKSVEMSYLFIYPIDNEKHLNEVLR